MKGMIAVSAGILGLMLIGLSAEPAGADDIDLDNLGWSVQYLIDQSQTVLGFDQGSKPRDNRGLAISPDGRYLYAGYNNGPEVRKIDLTEPDYTLATEVRTTAVRGKSIAVDDAGRVYFAEGSSIKIYDADLATLQHTVTLSHASPKCEGIAVTREADQLVLYGTDRDSQSLLRWALTESGGAVTADAQGGLGAGGMLNIAGASNLRGCEVDSSGRIWMADISANKVFRVDNDGTGLTSADVTEAMDIGFDGSVALVTQYTTRTITVLNISDLSVAHSPLTAPWDDLELDSDGQSGGGALSGIVVQPGQGFYVANEAGQTANEKSIYGRIDDYSGTIEGKFYTSTSHDDNDPILHAVPEPATIGLVALGLLGLATRRRRR